MIYTSNKGRKIVSQRKIRGKPKIQIGLLILIILILVFFIRVIGVLKENKERGAFVYVQLLNIGLPIVENEVYDEVNYSENKISISNICFEALGLKNITYGNILSNELSLLGNINGKNYVSKDEGESSNIFAYNPFELSEDSISKETYINDSTSTGIYNPALKKQIDNSKPEVLIYHTHTSENYDVNSPDSLNEDTNVVGVGDVLENELINNYGISVIHDKTNHSVSYNESYSRSASTVDYYLKEYGDFKMIIDLHRDSIEDKSVTTTEVYGMNASKIMFVNAKNSTRYEKNKELTEKIFNKTKELFPTLPRDIYTYNRGKDAFNLSKSDGSVLFEIGSHTNTPEESKVTAECMARVIAEILNGNE